MKQKYTDIFLSSRTKVKLAKAGSVMKRNSIIEAEQPLRIPLFLKPHQLVQVPFAIPRFRSLIAVCKVNVDSRRAGATCSS